MARIELLDEVQMRSMNLLHPDLELAELPHLFPEFHGSEAGAQEQFRSFRDIAEDYSVQDFAFAENVEDRNCLWAARHHAYSAAKTLKPGAFGVVTDCGVPISELSCSVRRIKQVIEMSGLIAPLVGHVGDGNFHLAILVDPKSDSEMQAARDLAAAVNDIALSLGGTVTGEHGVGISKKKYMHKEHGAAYALKKRLKDAFDPTELMNPHKLV